MIASFPLPLFRTASDGSWAELGNEAITWVLLYNHHTLYLWFGPGLSTAISSTAVLSTLGSSNPVSSTNKYLDLLASIHYFLVRFMVNPLYFERTWLGGQFDGGNETNNVQYSLT